MRYKHPLKRGDTIIEVTFAITVFCIIALLSINLMNSGVSTAQATTELTLARAEIDAQAEALRFIHNSYAAERNFEAVNKTYHYLWTTLTSERFSTEVDYYRDFADTFHPNTCEEVYGNGPDEQMHRFHPFVINTRLLDPTEYIGPVGSNSNSLSEVIVSAHDGVGEAGNRFHEANLFPRVIYSSSKYGDDAGSDLIENDDAHQYLFVSRVEGIWVIAVPGEPDDITRLPEFYDFHIRTCWYAPGRNYPTTIGTIVRLYNPDVIEGTAQ